MITVPPGVTRKTGKPKQLAKQIPQTQTQQDGKQNHHHQQKTKKSPRQKNLLIHLLSK